MKRNLKTKIRNANTTWRYIAMLLLIGCSAYATDWATVSTSGPTDLDASTLKANYGGSGLGTVAWGQITQSKPVGKATKCCQDKCYCGSVETMRNITLPGTIYIAKTQAFYSLAGNGTGEITATTRSEAESHERCHIRVRTDVASKMNPYVASKYTTITTYAYSTEQKAKNAAYDIALFFNTNLQMEFGKKIGKPSGGGFDNMDGIEVSNVVSGEWRVQAGNRNSVFIPISSYSPSVTVPEDKGTADCK